MNPLLPAYALIALAFLAAAATHLPGRDACVPAVPAPAPSPGLVRGGAAIGEVVVLVERRP